MNLGRAKNIVFNFIPFHKEVQTVANDWSYRMDIVENDETLECLVSVFRPLFV